MKIVITGHTGLLGKEIAKLFPNDEVIGLSRSNGYDLTANYGQILDIMKTADIVFNNAHVGTIQANVIEDLKDTNLTLITSGSIAANYNTTQYQLDKRVIQDTFHKNKKFYPSRCLLIKPGYLSANFNSIRMGATLIELKQVTAGIEYFLVNRRVTLIEFDNVIGP
jgi:hypothetical protein